MTVLNSRAREQPQSGLAGPPGRALVLVGFGLAGAPAPGGLPPLPAVAQRLATLLALPVHRLSPSDDPDCALAAMGTAWAAGAEAGAGPQAPGRAPGGLGLLEIDPGLSLPAGGSWVEALGAWRQPCVLVIAAGQLPCGWPAAGTALLQRWGVPLLGLLQWGGSWDAPARRRDGLPWLGMAAVAAEGVAGASPAGEGVAVKSAAAGVGAVDEAAVESEAVMESEAALAEVLAQRWQRLDLD